MTDRRALERRQAALGPHDVDCPKCGAPKGVACDSRHRVPHKPRVALAARRGLELARLRRWNEGCQP